MEGGLSSISLKLENQLTSLGLASEVELPEQPTRDVDIAKETTVASQPMDTQGIPLSSSSVPSKVSPSLDPCVSQGSADLSASVATLKGNETSVTGRGYGRPAVQQKQGETTQMVAIIPTQVRLKGLDWSTKIP